MGDAGRAHPYDGTVTTGTTWAARLYRGVAVVAAALLSVVLSHVAFTPEAAAATAPKLTLVMSSMQVSGSGPTGAVSMRLKLTNTGSIPAYGVLAKIWRSREPITQRAHLMEVAQNFDVPGGSPNQPGNYQLITNSTTAFAPGSSREFTLTGTFAQLGLSSTAADYAIGVDVVATADQSSKNDTVAQIRTFVPVPGLNAVPVAPVVVLSAAPTKLGANLFASEALSGQLTGRLSALLATAINPRFSWVIDPALLDEVRDQADGYLVADGTTTKPGTGQQVAADWLARFNTLEHARGGRTLFANPDTYGAQLNNVAQLASWSKIATSEVAGISDLPLVVLPSGNQVTNDSSKYLSGTSAAAIAASNTGAAGALVHTDSASPIMNVATTTASDQASTDSTVRITQRQLALAESLLCGPAGQTRLLTTVAEVNQNTQAQASWITSWGLHDVLASKAKNSAHLTDAKPPHLDDTKFATLNQLAGAYSAYNQLVPNSALGAHPQAAYLRTISTAWLDDASAGNAYTRALEWQIAPAATKDRLLLNASPRFLMSARSNQFPVTVTNDMLEPVQVRVVISPANPQRLQVPPSELITIAPGQSQTVNIHPEAYANGLIGAEAHAEDASGRQVSKDISLSIEVTDLGLIAWIIVGVSGAVLVGATAWRIRQVRRRDRESDEASAENQKARNQE